MGWGEVRGWLVTLGVRISFTLDWTRRHVGGDSVVVDSGNGIWFVFPSLATLQGKISSGDDGIGEMSQLGTCRRR